MDQQAVDKIKVQRDYYEQSCEKLAAENWKLKTALHTILDHLKMALEATSTALAKEATND